jgi:hypothetical protein
MFVFIAMTSSEVISLLKTKVGEVHGNLKSKASCALDHFSLYLKMFLLIAVTCPG